MFQCSMFHQTKHLKSVDFFDVAFVMLLNIAYYINVNYHQNTFGFALTYPEASPHTTAIVND